MAIKVTEIELSKPLKPLRRLDYQCSHVKALVRLHGEPLGWIKIENEHLPFSARQVGEIILRDHSWPLYEQSLRHLLDTGRGVQAGEQLISAAFAEPVAPRDYSLATAVVWLPYHKEVKNLKPIWECLEAIHAQDHPNFEIIIACNGTIPAGLPDMAKKVRAQLVSGANVFYRTVEEAQGEVISFTGPQGKPDKGWLRAISDATADNPKIAGITGSLFPLELETEAQIDFEWRAKHPYWFVRYYNYGQVYELPPENFGLPLNASFRRSFLLEQCNNDLFALDFGLKEMLMLYYQSLKLGYMVGYEPKALVWERYPREWDEANQQIEQENRERAEFLASVWRWNPNYRKTIWEKFKTNPQAKATLRRMVLRRLTRGLQKGGYAGHG